MEPAFGLARTLKVSGFVPINSITEAVMANNIVWGY